MIEDAYEEAARRRLDLLQHHLLNGPKTPANLLMISLVEDIRSALDGKSLMTEDERQDLISVVSTGNLDQPR